jgi:toxin ParE1/3/4
MPRRGRVRFAQAARRDLQAIWRHVGESSGVERADALVDRIVAAGRSLAHAPARGTLVPAFGHEVRQLVVLSYRILYRLTGDRVEVVRIIHVRRDPTKAWREPG